MGKINPAWAFLHNCVAHPLEGLWTLATWGRPVPAWVDRFHERTARLAYKPDDALPGDAEGVGLQDELFLRLYEEPLENQPPPA